MKQQGHQNTSSENHRKNRDFNKIRSKNKGHATQLKTIFEYLRKNVATASMVSAATGVPQKCITRYKRDLELAGKLWEVDKRLCKETGFRAWYLTCDPEKAPKCNNQLKLC